MDLKACETNNAPTKENVLWATAFANLGIPVKIAARSCRATALATVCAMVVLACVILVLKVPTVRRKNFVRVKL